MTTLLPQHEALIRASGISPEVVEARGYRSVTSRAELRRLGFGPSQCLVPALLIPVWNVTGNVALHQIRPDQPRIRRGRPLKYETPTGARMALDVPPPAHQWLGDPRRPLFITEGVRKADSAVSAGLCCVALLGVWNFRGTNEHGGKVALADWESVALNGRQVYVVFDSDVTLKPEVHGALVRLKALLERRVAAVLVIYLPPGEGGAKTGLDDFLASGQSVDNLLALASPEVRSLPQDATPDPSGGPSLRRSIDAADLNLPRVAARAWAALEAANAPPILFRMGSTQARLEVDVDNVPALRPLNVDRLRYQLARAADWRRGSGPDAGPALPPEHVARDLLARPDPPLPVLARIVAAPVFAADGRLMSEQGYHADAQTYYAPAPKLIIPPVPEHPSAADVARARSLLCDDLLGEFPFVGEAERAHAVALLLLPFVRDLINGRTPLHLIEKPAPGTGAGLLVRALTLPALGRPPAMMTEGRDEDEWRKRLTAKLVGAPTIVVVDNVRRRLDAAALSSAITAEVWEDRLLGQTQMVRAPVRCAWVAIGNNPALSGEIARRTVRIRLDAKVDRPWLRTGFKHPDLVAWATVHRGELIGAALTFARAWLVAGRPQGSVILGEFEAWAHTMGGILKVAGIEGFLGNLAEFYELADAEGAEIRRLLAAWWVRYHDAPVSVGQLFELATSDEVGLDLSAKTDHGQRVQLGIRVAGLRDRRYGLSVEGEELTVCVLGAGKEHQAGRWRLIISSLAASSPSGREKIPQDSPDSPEMALSGPQDLHTPPETGECGNLGESFTGSGPGGPGSEKSWPADSCRSCGGRRWWRSTAGQACCCTCHPPAVPELVAASWDGGAA
jgi:hypothetical protein